MADLKGVAGLVVPVDLETGNIDWNGNLKSFTCMDSDITATYHNNIRPYIQNGDTLYVKDTTDLYMYEESNNTWILQA